MREISFAGGSGSVSDWSSLNPQVFGPASPSGTYRITNVSVFDQAGNSQIYSPADLTALGIRNEFSVSSPGPSTDRTPPVLTSLVLPDTISLGTGSTGLVSSIGATDDASGVAQVSVIFDRPFRQGGSNSLNLLYSNAADFRDDGQVTKTDFLSSDTPVGRYIVQRVEVTDAAGNVAVYGWDKLAAIGASTGFTVVNTNLSPTVSIVQPGSIREGDAPFTLGLNLTGGTMGLVNVSVVAGANSGRTDDLIGPAYDTAPFSSDDRTLALPAVAIVDDYEVEPDETVSVYVTARGQVFANGTDRTTVTLTLIDNDRIGTDAGETMRGDDGRSSLSGLGGDDTIVGLGGDDRLFGGSGADILDGGPGNDSLYGGDGDDSLIGGDGTDVYDGGAGVDLAILTRNLSDYNVIRTDADDLILSVRGSSISQTLTSSMEYVAFSGGQTLTYASLSTYGQAIDTSGDDVFVAPATGTVRFDGGLGNDTFVLNGNVADYRLTRAPFGYSASEQARVGDFILTATNGSGTYSVSQSVETIRFQNGQYLSLQDLPAFIAGDPRMTLGALQDDRMYQTQVAGYQAFGGLDGNDTVYLLGSASDYAVRAMQAQAPVQGGGTVRLIGVELVATNGSGSLLIDSSVETVQFRNGQRLAFADLDTLSAAPATPGTVLYLKLPGDPIGSVTFGRDDFPGFRSDGNADRVLLNGNVGDYTLGRPDGSTYRLTLTTSGEDAEVFNIATSIESVQFRNGQYLALKDLAAYVNGVSTVTTGTGFDDVLILPRGGDHVLNGGAGLDAAYLQGNVNDYTLRTVSPTSVNGMPINGFELVADNGSGNILIDRSTEVVHFENGQYLAIQDLPAYVDMFV
ncbi:hypothetical protein FHS99_001582 [Sphingomonas prati]|uniref:Calcium-binding protein n=1 Tax=Sphingomonas prati TaxID=1843237 RepID=A0A7W9BS32_9SPHN|nr:calcium-binding protein [Sphingomonas prati]MBB5729104.1 hypothetical protein [Sphingomonas prati]